MVPICPLIWSYAIGVNHDCTGDNIVATDTIDLGNIVC